VTRGEFFAELNAAKLLTRDQARRIAANIAKLPTAREFKIRKGIDARSAAPRRAPR
jgi:hypothetical protein